LLNKDWDKNRAYFSAISQDFIKNLLVGGVETVVDWCELGEKWEVKLRLAICKIGCSYISTAMLDELKKKRCF